MDKYKLTKYQVEEVLYLDEQSGVLTWKYRDRSMFTDDKSHRLWNLKHGGREAFTARDKKGYARGCIFSNQYSAHSVVWLLTHGYWPSSTGMMVDHINGKTDDNRPSNLRLVNPEESSKNRSKPTANKSGQVGVTLDKQSGKWKAHIKNNGKQITLGRFENKDEAIKARKDAELKFGYHANHGRINPLIKNH